MKTRVIVAVVVMIHCVAVGTVLMQGCRSTGGESMAPDRTDISNAPIEPMEPMVDDVPALETAPEMEVVIPQIETTSYVIRKGDTLGAIAKHYGVRVGDIMALNGLENANKIRVGQKVMLPGIHNVTSLPPVSHSTPKRKKTESAEPVAVASADGQGYTIKKGDSLSTIAKSFGVSVKALKEANNLSSDKITAGKKLTIPGSAPVAPVEPVAPTTDVVTPAPVDAMTPPPAIDLTAGSITKPDVIDTSDLELDAAAPSTQPVDPSVTPVAPVAPMASSDFKAHTVSANEDLSTIAIQWGVTEDAIRSANGLTSDALTEGQVLKIPAH